MLSGRTLRRMERDFLLSAPPGQINGGIHLHDFSLLCRGETLAHTKPLTRTTCHLSTMEDPYFTLCKAWLVLNSVNFPRKLSVLNSNGLHRPNLNEALEM